MKKTACPARLGGVAACCSRGSAILKWRLPNCDFYSFQMAWRCSHSHLRREPSFLLSYSYAILPPATSPARSQLLASTPFLSLCLYRSRSVAITSGRLGCTSPRLARSHSLDAARQPRHTRRRPFFPCIIGVHIRHDQQQHFSRTTCCISLCSASHRMASQPHLSAVSRPS